MRFAVITTFFLVLISMLSGCGQEHSAAPPPSDDADSAVNSDFISGGGALVDAARAAEKEFKVPARLILATLYVHSNFRGGRCDNKPTQSPTVHSVPAYGFFAAMERTVAEASVVLGEVITPEQLDCEVAPAIRLQAALLSREANANPSMSWGKGSDWLSVVAAVERFNLPTIDESLIAATTKRVQEILVRGVSGTDSFGNTITILPDPNLLRLSLALLTVPEQTGAEWIPAGEGHYTQYSSNRNITHIVIHGTAGTFESAIAHFQIEASPWTSAHYVLRSNDGHIVQMVIENDAAHHVSCNGFNIGIEHEILDNDPHNGRFDDSESETWYTNAMYHASAFLVRSLGERHDIPIDREHIVGHDEAFEKLPSSACSEHADPGPDWDWDLFIDLASGPGLFVDGWHDNGSSESFLSAYRSSSLSLGVSVDNGGSIWIHEMPYASRPELVLQDFFKLASPQYGDGHTAIVGNIATQTAHVVKEGFWGAYKCLELDGHALAGGRLLGAPTSDDEFGEFRPGSWWELPITAQHQEFEKGMMWWDTSNQTVHVLVDSFVWWDVDSASCEPLHVVVEPWHGTGGGLILCDPCVSDSECVNGRCVTQDGQQWYCGESCTDNTDCPSDYSCEPMQSKDGTTSYQCVPIVGTCHVEACTPDCAGRFCGPDGCNGSCGTCTNGRTCDLGTWSCILSTSGDEECETGSCCNAMTGQFAGAGVPCGEPTTEFDCSAQCAGALTARISRDFCTGSSAACTSVLRRTVDDSDVHTCDCNQRCDANEGACLQASSCSGTFPAQHPFGTLIRSLSSPRIYIIEADGHIRHVQSAQDEGGGYTYDVNRYFTVAWDVVVSDSELASYTDDDDPYTYSDDYAYMLADLFVCPSGSPFCTAGKTYLIYRGWGYPYQIQEVPASAIDIYKLSWNRTQVQSFDYSNLTSVVSGYAPLRPATPFKWKGNYYTVGWNRTAYRLNLTTSQLTAAGYILSDFITVADSVPIDSICTIETLTIDDFGDSCTSSSSDWYYGSSGVALAGGAGCYTGTPATQGRGQCRDGVVSWSSGTFRCVGEVLPSPELCGNTVDDDCDDATDTADASDCPTSTGPVDADGDGWTAGSDCDDHDAAINPGATERCNGLDDDCDSLTDEAPADSEPPCSDEPHPDIGVECYDAHPETMNVGICRPGTVNYDELDVWFCDGQVVPQYEVCTDALDNDCDGRVDREDTADCPPDVMQLDIDGDGFPRQTDCDDYNAAIHPGAAELCNNRDDDCDSETDETYLAVGTPCDGDDLDSCTNGTYACHPDGTAISCVNETASYNEVCDGADNDCDGQTDEGLRNACGTCGAVPTEACGNNLDDDCDGHTDEDCGPCAVDNAACDDGVACTTNDRCSNRTCAGTPDHSRCTPSNQCMTAICGTSGCSETPRAGVCDDGNACTTNDACSGGLCVGTVGACSAGAVETTACGACGEGTRSRTCTSTCSWGDWSQCMNTGCAPGGTEPCSNEFGTGVRTCTGFCQWSACDAGPAIYFTPDKTAIAFRLDDLELNDGTSIAELEAAGILCSEWFALGEPFQHEEVLNDANHDGVVEDEIPLLRYGDAPYAGCCPGGLPARFNLKECGWGSEESRWLHLIPGDPRFNDFVLLGTDTRCVCTASLAVSRDASTGVWASGSELSYQCTPHSELCGPDYPLHEVMVTFNSGASSQGVAMGDLCSGPLQSWTEEPYSGSYSRTCTDVIPGLHRFQVKLTDLGENVWAASEPVAGQPRAYYGTPTVTAGGVPVPVVLAHDWRVEWGANFFACIGPDPCEFCCDGIDNDLDGDLDADDGDCWDVSWCPPSVGPCGDGTCDATEDCASCPADCGTCPAYCGPPSGGCNPFETHVTGGTGSGYITWYDQVGQPLASYPLPLSGGTYSSPQGACAVSVPEGRTGDCFLCTLGREQDFCALPGGGYGCAHNGDCAQ